MFEEADEIAKDIYIHHFDDDINYPDVLKAIAVGVQKGAEFGYNKADEWHYPSKGEYPIDKTEMLVYFKYADYEYPCKTFGFYNGHFWDTKRGDVSNKEVIAWKEIVFPKETENA